MVDLDASKTGDSIPQEGGRGISDENPMNLLQGGERTVAGVSPEQKVKKRKTSKCGKRVKKRKSKGMVHLLRAIAEENEKIKSGNDILKQKLQLRQDGIEIQKTELCVSLNKTITVQENLVEALCQDPSVQSLMVGSDHLNVAQYAMLFPNADGDVRLPSKANQSFNDITELKHRFMEGRYEYKYIVDGEWTINKHELVTTQNKDGHVNNYVQVLDDDTDSANAALQKSLTGDDPNLTGDERLRIRRFLEALPEDEG